jgi:hypothetical protein
MEKEEFFDRLEKRLAPYRLFPDIPTTRTAIKNEALDEIDKVIQETNF